MVIHEHNCMDYVQNGPGPQRCPVCGSSYGVESEYEPSVELGEEESVAMLEREFGVSTGERRHAYEACGADGIYPVYVSASSFIDAAVAWANMFHPGQCVVCVALGDDVRYVEVSG